MIDLAILSSVVDKYYARQCHPFYVHWVFVMLSVVLFYLVIPSPQIKVGTALFTGLCSPDGCSEAPMDGFMASR